MWKAFRLEMRPAGPFAVGPGWRLGFVLLTRLDVPPRTSWGAFTDALTRWALANNRPKDVGIDDSSRPYERTGTWVAQNVRFLSGILVLKEGNEVRERVLPSYHFGEGTGFRVWRPGEGAGHWVRESEHQIRTRYVSAGGSTALTYDAMAGRDGTLHETEHVMHQVRLGEGGTGDVWIETFLFVQEGHALFLKTWMEEKGPTYLRLGRDITGGDGCLERITACEVTELGDISRMRGLDADQSTEWKMDTPHPTVGIEPHAATTPGYLPLRLPAPFLFRKNQVGPTGYWGDLRPNILREYDNEKGFGRKTGYPANEEEWILDHGGAIAAEPGKERHWFHLDRDGWVSAPLTRSFTMPPSPPKFDSSGLERESKSP